jgi:hypothetical protein
MSEKILSTLLNTLHSRQTRPEMAHRNAEPEKHSETGWFGLDELPEQTTLPTRNAVGLLRGWPP